MDVVNERVTSLQSDVKNTDKDRLNEWKYFVKTNTSDGTYMHTILFTT